MNTTPEHSADSKDTSKDTAGSDDTGAGQGLYQADDPLAPTPVDAYEQGNAHAAEEEPAAPAADASGPDPEAVHLAQELSAVKEKMLRAVAEAENIRRRAVREREDASKYAIAGFAKDLLSVSDNLRRALDAVPDDVKANEKVAPLVTGIEATERELLRSFEKNGVKKVDPLDEPFDPNFHEVMFETPDAGKPPGTVVQVVETGYVLNGRLLRPARVGVAKGGDGAPASSGTTGSTVDTEA